MRFMIPILQEPKKPCASSLDLVLFFIKVVFFAHVV
jgi:hypothetical protein